MKVLKIKGREGFGFASKIKFSHSVLYFVHKGYAVNVWYNGESNKFICQIDSMNVYDYRNNFLSLKDALNHGKKLIGLK